MRKEMTIVMYVIHRGDWGPPAITSVISQLRDWRGRNRAGATSSPQAARKNTPEPYYYVLSTSSRVSSDCDCREGLWFENALMLLLKAKILLGLLVLYWFLIDSTDARRGRTRSRTKSKVTNHQCNSFLLQLS